MSEATIQSAIVRYLRYQLPSTYRVFAVPNGAQRTQSGRPANAVAGLTRGIPDLCIIGPEGKAHFIEVKNTTGRLTPEQREFADYCLNNLVGWALCRSVVDVEAAIRHWKII
jgi:hypothetical protein